MYPESNNLIHLVRQWGRERGLTEEQVSHPQMSKLMEEVGELASAINKKQPSAIRDELGDCVVVLTILAAQNGLLLEHCIEDAYNKIKNRKGKMIDGTFVKEEDLAA